MGAARSREPRSVSMENPGPAGIIDISDDVVKRLREGIREQAKERQASASKEVAVTPPTPTATPTQQPPKPEPVKPAVPVKQPRTVVYSSADSYAMPGGTTITAADIRREKELELAANDKLWRERMENLEKTLNKTNAVMEGEYATAVNDVKQRFANAPARLQLPPCQDLKAQLIACYRAYPGETLKCAEEVELFRNCVNAHRLKKLDNEKEEVNTSVASSKPTAAKAG